MSNRETMQQALECIERLNLRGFILADFEDEVYAAIAALKSALAQPEQEPVAWRDPTNIDPGQGCTYTKEKHEQWPHIYRQALYTAPPAAQPEPVSMRMPKVGNRVICLEDESLGKVVSLTAGGSPDITFDDGSHGTYLLSEFAELFGYVTPPAAQPAQSLDDLVAEFESTPAGTESMRQGREWLKDLQPEQEPVACRFCHSKKGCWTWQCYDCGEIDDVQKPAAQRPWIGLEPKEILDLFDVNNVYGSKWIEFARTVEAKLKECNHG